MNNHYVLNMGAGRQTTAIYLMLGNGDLDIPCDVAVFADTGEEPKQVYEHLEWLGRQPGPDLVIRSAGRLGDDLMRGRNSTGQRFASIPAYTRHSNGQIGKTRRQCTREYKIDVIEQYVRREMLGLEPRKHVPKDVHVTHYMGFSVDEPGRAARARMRFSHLRWGSVEFPLFHDDLMMTEADCVRYCERHVPHQVLKSACVFCPYRSDSSWKRMKLHQPEDWTRAVEVDRAMRVPGTICNRNMEAELFVHRSGIPLEDVPLEAQGELFSEDCEGGCGL